MSDSQLSASDMGSELLQELEYRPVLPPDKKEAVFLGETSLDVARILLKFFYLEADFGHLTPKGIEDRGLQDTRKISGYKDDGIQPINTKYADVSGLRTGLANNKFFLTQAWTYHKFEPDYSDRSGSNRKKIAVTMEFKPAEGPNELHSRIIGGLRNLTGMIWKECFVWANPDNHMSPGKSITINLRTPCFEEFAARLWIENHMLKADGSPRPPKAWLPERAPKNPKH